jgi:hypothetical protein
VNYPSAARHARLPAERLAEHLAVARRFEGVANVLDCRRAFGLGPCDCDDVESRSMLEQIMAFEPRQRESRQTTLLSGIDRLRWMAAVMGPAGFDLNKHDGAMVDGDEVDFSQSATGSAIDDRVALASQIAFGRPFTLKAERNWRAKLPPMLDK